MHRIIRLRVIIGAILLWGSIVRVDCALSDEPGQRLIGSWRLTDRGKTSVKTFRADGTYTEVRRLLGAKATVTGVYRVEGQELLWVAQKLTIDRAGGDVLPPTRDVHLDREQKARMSWKGADTFVISGDREILYRRVRP
jgi:hypothetical protein